MREAAATYSGAADAVVVERVQAAEAAARAVEEAVGRAAAIPAVGEADETAAQRVVRKASLEAKAAVQAPAEVEVGRAARATARSTSNL